MNIKTKTFISAITALLLTGVLGAHVGNPMSNESRIDSLQQYEIRKPIDISDTVTYDNSTELQRKYLPGEVRDTVELFSRKQRTHDYSSKISLLTRSYGDSIVLRWAAEDYVSWQYLNSVGVDVLRGYIDNDVYHLDTLATALKPWTLEQFKATYQESDSIAAMAMGMLYGEGKMRQDQSQYAPGSIGALMDVHGDQQMTFGFAVLVSEWRRDLAESMAMRFVDRTAKKNVSYSYFVMPSVEDSTGHIFFANGGADDVKVEKYKPEVFDTEIGDSLVSPNNIRLWWDNNKYYYCPLNRKSPSPTP